MKEGIDSLFKEINKKKSSDFDDENSDGKCVILDVGGDRFVASRKHLERFPSTRWLSLIQQLFKNQIFRLEHHMVCLGINSSNFVPSFEGLDEEKERKCAWEALKVICFFDAD